MGFQPHEDRPKSRGLQARNTGTLARHTSGGSTGFVWLLLRTEQGVRPAAFPEEARFPSGGSRGFQPPENRPK
jgi:hypothetical protein